MKLKKIDIDGFGVWNGLAIDDLADTTTVVYGPNEAGKTTLMQFVRAVLYGFTPERRKKYLPPVNGGQPGGRLVLADAVGQFHLHRTASLSDRPDEAGPLAIIDDRGEPPHAAGATSVTPTAARGAHRGERATVGVPRRDKGRPPDGVVQAIVTASSR